MNGAYIQVPARGWEAFNFDLYQCHSHGCGYAAPDVCLSAAHEWLDVVKHEFIRWCKIKPNRHHMLVRTGELAGNWRGDGVCIVMYDGSTTTLGTMLRLYLPDACVKRYDKCAAYSEYKVISEVLFIVMCEDGINSGESLCRMRQFVGRPIDLFLTIRGNSLDFVSIDILETYKYDIEDLVKVHYQLDKGCNRWDTVKEEASCNSTPLQV